MSTYIANANNFTESSTIEKNKKEPIRINIEYQKIVPSLTTKEYDSLKFSIKESRGNIVPIIINPHEIILDGHQRYRACKELGLEPRTEIKEFSDQLLEKEFIITINRIRRQLNAFQIAELGYKLEEIEREKSRIRLSEAGKLGSDIRWKAVDTNVQHDGVGSIEPTPSQQERGKTSDIIAEKMGLSPTTYFKARKIIIDSSEEQKQRLREGKDRIDRIYKQIQKSKKREELLNLIKQSSSQLSDLFHVDNSSSNNNRDEFVTFKLFCGDLSKKGKEIPSESIDLIFTDPPYSSKDVFIYSDLAVLASKVLKQGGSLVTYFGQHNLPEVLEIVTPHLKYWWSIAVKHTGPTKAFHQRQVFVLWKPLLWFVKGDKLSKSFISSTTNEITIGSNYLYDYIESKTPEKNLHPWEQSTVEVEYIIKKLTFENQIVLDPLMGSGTTGIAALNTKRRFIGIEKNDDDFKIAESRLAAITTNNNITFQDSMSNNQFKTEKIETCNLVKSAKLQPKEVI